MWIKGKGKKGNEVGSLHIYIWTTLHLSLSFPRFLQFSFPLFYCCCLFKPSLHSHPNSHHLHPFDSFPIKPLKPPKSIIQLIAQFKNPFLAGQKEIASCSGRRLFRLLESSCLSLPWSRLLVVEEEATTTTLLVVTLIKNFLRPLLSTSALWVFWVFFLTWNWGLSCLLAVFVATLK